MLYHGGRISDNLSNLVPGVIRRGRNLGVRSPPLPSERTLKRDYAVGQASHLSLTSKTSARTKVSDECAALTFP